MSGFALGVIIQLVIEYWQWFLGAIIVLGFLAYWWEKYKIYRLKELASKSVAEVECPSCQNKVLVKNDDVLNRRTIICPHCNSYFEVRPKSVSV